MKFSPQVLALLQGSPFGSEDGRSLPPPLARDGRTECLRVLKLYLQDLEFHRPGGVDEKGCDRPDIIFKIPEDDIHIGWPDYTEELNYPSIIMLSSAKTDYEMLGYGTIYDDQTFNKYAPNTVVVSNEEHVEIFTMEIWAAKAPELRSILAGLESALTPTEAMYGLRFHVPKYFDQLVRFTLEDSLIIDNEDAGKNRRRAQISIEMAFQVSYLVNTSTLELVVNNVVDATEVEPYLVVKDTGDSVVVGETDIVDPTKLDRVSREDDCPAGTKPNSSCR